MKIAKNKTVTMKIEGNSIFVVLVLNKMRGETGKEMEPSGDMEETLVELIYNFNSSLHASYQKKKLNN